MSHFLNNEKITKLKVLLWFPFNYKRVKNLFKLYTNSSYELIFKPAFRLTKYCSNHFTFIYNYTHFSNELGILN